MKQVTIQDGNGNNTTAFVPENGDDIKKQLENDRKQNLKEHLYMGYLIVGTLAFTLGILISIKRLYATK